MTQAKGLLCPVLLLVSTLGCTKPGAFPEGRWIDLSHDFSSETLYWPTSERFALDTVFSGFTNDGYYYTAFNFSAAEHGGTHIDAPIHFAKDRPTVDQIPVEQLMGPAVVVDVSEKALSNRDYQVTIEDFMDWESAHGQLPQNAIVLLRTGYGQYWPDAKAYMGTDQRGQQAVADLHFPGLDPDAVRWLVKNRSIGAVGIDTPSIDTGQSQLFESHQVLFKENVPAFENVANLDQLPAKGALVIALPMKIKGGSGGPFRIVALLGR